MNDQPEAAVVSMLHDSLFYGTYVESAGEVVEDDRPRDRETLLADFPSLSCRRAEMVLQNDPSVVTFETRACSGRAVATHIGVWSDVVVHIDEERARAFTA